MNPKIEANLVKIGIGILFSIPIAYLVKMNAAVDDKVDAHYKNKKDGNGSVSE